MEMEKRKVSDSIVETVHMVRPQHLNASDRLFGGALMQWIDEVAGMVAKRHTRRNVITASVDSLSFLRGAYVKDTVVIIGKVTYVGNTSMEVKVDTYVEALSGERTPINHAYFTMVALDAVMVAATAVDVDARQLTFSCIGLKRRSHFPVSFFIYIYNADTGRSHHGRKTF